MRPLHGYVLVRIDKPRATYGRLLLPDTAKERPQWGQVCGLPDGGNAHNLALGDWVVYNKFAERSIADDVAIIAEEELVCVVET